MDNEELFNRVTRWMISIRDFQIARSAATFLIEDVDDLAQNSLETKRRFKCYETTMVVAYCRPFSMSKGVVDKLKPIEIGLCHEDKFFPTHQRLILLRNKLFGHSDAEHVEMRVLNIKMTDDFQFQIPRFDENLLFSTEEVFAIHEETLRAIGVLTERIMQDAPQFSDRYTSLDLM